MGNLKVFNSAGIGDDENTITSVGSQTGRIIDLFATKEEVEATKAMAEENKEKVDTVIEDAPEEMDTLKEVSEELDDAAFQDFLNALG